MKNALLACMIIASLAGCSTEGSGSSSPPAAQAQSNAQSTEWRSEPCAELPYTPGPANCK
jgi:uncharacterized protein YceK